MFLEKDIKVGNKYRSLCNQDCTAPWGYDVDHIDQNAIVLVYKIVDYQVQLFIIEDYKKFNENEINYTWDCVSVPIGQFTYCFEEMKNNV